EMKHLFAVKAEISSLKKILAIYCVKHAMQWIFKISSGIEKLAAIRPANVGATVSEMEAIFS
ncbi:MAG: hypothetical protein PV354_06910, partial [Bartonella sp.]|nr:hypothetical protein [Bartonella sp.]